MKGQEIAKLGVPSYCVADAVNGIAELAKDGLIKRVNLTQEISSVVAEPNEFVEHKYWSNLALSLIDYNSIPDLKRSPYKIWGSENIEDEAVAQLDLACYIPAARQAALMPDAHLGYGLCIGGVLAVKDAVIPYAVGMDIACRMKMSVLDINVTDLDENKEILKEILEANTRFGQSNVYETKKDHDVLDDERWNELNILKNLKDKAWVQLGTSGSGNHFCDLGILTIDGENELKLPKGQYVALLSHSGSRGAGANICKHYSRIAQDNLHPKYADKFSELAWLDMDSSAGQEYWTAMNLMGDYAKANHDVIHRNISKGLASDVLCEVENHHNFAWKENHDGEELIVHRKGATPAAAGVLGIIPGSMATPSFIVRGKGNADSLNSSSHGAGRVSSRKKAKANLDEQEELDKLRQNNVELISGCVDEMPAVYKSIEQVMDAQKDLVEAIARFDPRIVKMCPEEKNIWEKHENIL